MDKKLVQVYNKIKSIEIQGATNVALAVANALKNYGKTLKAKNSRDFVRKIKSAGKYLVSARATEPMADNVTEFAIFYLKRNIDMPVGELKNILNESLSYFFALAKKNEANIINSGEKLIKSKYRIFTHCHSSTVIKILQSAKKNKKNFQVFQTETRPLYQGRKTADELVKAGIKDTLIVDSAGASVLAQEKFDLLLLGADAIARDGSCVNKVGSFGLAQIAFLNKIPVYIATQALKINEDAKNLKAIKMEMRDAKEIWEKAPRGLKILNPAFDKIPAEFISGYITDFGIIKPQRLFKKIKRNYKFIF
ncbi:translation initiation factor eIF-2B [Patescibacteria group bacterium]|nr:translation initiation factor eIF-2B [Patescibacteria group bacterium]